MLLLQRLGGSGVFLPGVQCNIFSVDARSFKYVVNHITLVPCTRRDWLKQPISGETIRHNEKPHSQIHPYPMTMFALY